MSGLVNDSLAYGMVLTLLVGASLFLCKRMSGRRITAERAFWGIWIFLILSAETATNFDFFNYPYAIEPDTRRYTLEVFLVAALGFVSSTMLLSIGAKRTTFVANSGVLEDWARLTERRKLTLSAAFFVIGAIQFIVNYSAYGNLLELRLASLEGAHAGLQAYIYFFYVAHAYLLLLGYLDGKSERFSRASVYMTLAGLILHSLSTGARINIIVAPLFYIVPYMLCLDVDRNVARRRYFRARKYFVKMLMCGFVIFSLAGLLRAFAVDISSVTTIDGFANKVVFAVPKYISDTYVSISVHARHALAAEPQLGRFTFDAGFRLLDQVGITEPLDPNLFGHHFYRDTPDPWAWTQVNAIPRLLADFGESLYLVALFLLVFLSQWLSLAAPKSGFLGNAIAAMAVICSLYTILGAMWLSAFTIIIISCCAGLRWAFVRGRRYLISASLGEGSVSHESGSR